MPHRSGLEPTIELLGVWGGRTMADVRLAATADFNEREIGMIIHDRSGISGSQKKYCAAGLPNKR